MTGFCLTLLPMPFGLKLSRILPQFSCAKAKNEMHLNISVILTWRLWQELSTQALDIGYKKFFPEPFTYCICSYKTTMHSKEAGVQHCTQLQEAMCGHQLKVICSSIVNCYESSYNKWHACGRTWEQGTYRGTEFSWGTVCSTFPRSATPLLNPSCKAPTLTCLWAPTAVPIPTPKT